MSSQEATTTEPRRDGAGSVQVTNTLTMSVTDLAKTKLDEFLGAERALADHGVRITVQPGGCSGATYGMEFGTQANAGETELVANGVRLWVDPGHAPVLNGLVIDFVDELMGGGFKIHNPNASSTCGCGKSFSA